MVAEQADRSMVGDCRNREKMKRELSIPVSREYLNKDACRREARRLLREGSIIDMSERQLAAELFFHAAVYYFCEKMNVLPRYREHANPIDLRDGGDTRLRRAVYSACWTLKKGK